MNDLKTPSGKMLRWVILLSMSVAVGATYYVYDAISTLKSFMTANLGFSSTEYGVIVSFYSFPNTFLALAVIGGIILDKIGIKKTGYFFIISCVIGAFLTAYGASDAFRQDGIGYGLLNSFLPEYSPELKMMIIGRFFFGLGAETFIVVQNKVIAKWFKGSELAFAFGLNLAICRIGTAAALIFSPMIAENTGDWVLSLWVMALIMFIGLLSFVLYSLLDRKKSESGTLLDPTEQFRFKDITDLLLNRSFVYITLLCLLFYAAVFPFLSYAPDMLLNKFGVTTEDSGLLTSIVIFGTILFTPLFGYLVDRKGKRASMMIVGSVALVLIHLYLSLTYLTPYIPMFMLGIAFSLVPAAMWPSVALIVEEKRLGTAYGLMTSIQNFGMWGIPILAGMITDASNPGITQQAIEQGAVLDYTNTLVLFAVLGGFAVLFAFLLKMTDSGPKGHGLEKPSIS